MNWPDPCSCDVMNRDGLTRFQDCLRRGKLILVSDDPASIEQQLIQLAWQDAVYRSFNEGLRLNRRKARPHPVPASLVELIHNRYFWSQAILLRRLFEQKQKAIHRQVYSIPSVIALIESYIECITREAYVCYDGTPYDTRDAGDDNHAELLSSGRHRVFDTIAAVSEFTRRRDDTVAASILPALRRKAVFPSRIEYYTNKYVAHASDPVNRAPPEALPQLPTLGHLQHVHKTAVWLSLSLGKLLDQLVLTTVPTPQFDQFDAWEESLFDAGTKHSLHKYWRRRAGLLDSWSDKYWQEEAFYLSPSRKLTAN